MMRLGTAVALSMLIPASDDPTAARWRSVLERRGEAEKGRAIFGDAKGANCVACHRVAGQGGDIGPDLSAIGGKFDPGHLLESVVAPSAQIVEGYRATNVALKDGRVLSGVIRGEEERTLALARSDGTTLEVDRREIEERSPSPTSIMPGDFAARLDDAALADLTAYLASLKPGGSLHVPDGFAVETIATGLTGATALAVAPDGRIFVCEQTGTLRLVRDGSLLPRPVATLEVDSSWERGLIGVAIDPDFPKSPYLYLCFVVPKPYPHHRVSRLTLRGDSAGEERVLFEGDDQTKLGGNVPAGHQGGAIHFGRDGMLYIALGEQTAGEPAQRLDSLLGKILRLRPDGSIPDDNPFVDQASGKYRAIWALGLRNPFTFAVQPETGRIFANDVGGVAEEINAIERGANYGWPTVEHGPTSDARFRGPIYHYPTASIAGGAFIPRSAPWPDALKGRYLFMDFVHGWMKSLDPEHPEDVRPFATGLARPVDLAFGPSGVLYVLQRDAWVIDGQFAPHTGSLLLIRPKR